MELTTTFFPSREQFAAFRTSFRKLANNRAVTPTDIMLYSIARGLPKERGFTPITNQMRLSNGAAPNGSLNSTVSNLRISLKRNPKYTIDRFGGTLTQEDIDRFLANL